MNEEQKNECFQISKIAFQQGYISYFLVKSFKLIFSSYNIW